MDSFLDSRSGHWWGKPLITSHHFGPFSLFFALAQFVEGKMPPRKGVPVSPENSPFFVPFLRRRGGGGGGEAIATRVRSVVDFLSLVWSRSGTRSGPVVSAKICNPVEGLSKFGTVVKERKSRFRFIVKRPSTTTLQRKKMSRHRWTSCAS